MLQRLTLIGAMLLLSLGVRCSADLADGNPCLAVVQAYCNWASRCNVLSEILPGDVDASGPTVSACVTTGLAAISASCDVSGSDARSCASAIDSLGCSGNSMVDGSVLPFDEGPSECLAIGIQGDAGGGFSFPQAPAGGGGSGG
jgi:hypothetical protein